MGISVEAWRSRIGCFTHPKQRHAVGTRSRKPTARTRRTYHYPEEEDQDVTKAATQQESITLMMSLTLSLRLIVLVLLLRAGVEQNPGPGDHSTRMKMPEHDEVSKHLFYFV